MVNSLRAAEFTPDILAYRASKSLEDLTIGQLRSIVMRDTSKNPARDRELQANGTHIYWFDGTNAVRLDFQKAFTTLLSAGFAIDSTGIKTVTTAHGLSVTPAAKDVQLTVVEDSDVDDWGFDLLKVESVDGTNVVAKINVSTASATGSSTAKLAILVAVPS